VFVNGTLEFQPPAEAEAQAASATRTTTTIFIAPPFRSVRLFSTIARDVLIWSDYI
jgi:hypothetical protein